MVTVLLALGPSSARAQTEDPSSKRPLAVAERRSIADSLTGEAKTDYEAAKRLFADGDMAGAVLKFRAAYEKSREPRLLWNMAACEKKARHYARALNLLEQYKREGAAIGLTANERKQTDEIIAALAGLVGLLRVEGAAPGSTLSIDGETVGTLPLESPLRVDLGHHKLIVTNPKGKPIERALVVQDTREIQIQLDGEAQPAVGTLSVNAGANDNIAVDGKSVGVGSWQGSLATGPHALRVTGEGMQPETREVVIEEGQTKLVGITLRPEARGEQEPISPGTILLLMGGGATLAGVVALATYVFSQPDATQRPPIQKGTLLPGVVTISTFR